MIMKEVMDEWIPNYAWKTFFVSWIIVLANVRVQSMCIQVGL